MLDARTQWGAAFLAVMVAISWGAISQHSPKTPKIPPIQKSHGITTTNKNTQTDQRATANDSARIEKQQAAHDQADARRQHNECQKNNSEYGMFFGACFKVTDFFLAVFNGLLVVVTAGLICVGVRQEIHLRDTARRELRAYIHVSPNPPGLQVGDEGTGIALHIKNYGKTPGIVTYILIKCDWMPNDMKLPDKPDYSGAQTEEPRGNFLGADHHFFHSGPIFTLPGKKPFIDPGEKLYIYGYVDYMDAFGDRYRSRYARRYLPRLEERSSYRSDSDFENRNNLALVSRRGYNYDHKRTKDEGHDWDEEFKS